MESPRQRLQDEMGPGMLSPCDANVKILIGWSMNYHVVGRDLFMNTVVAGRGGIGPEESTWIRVLLYRRHPTPHWRRKKRGRVFGGFFVLSFPLAISISGGTEYLPVPS